MIKNWLYRNINNDTFNFANLITHARTQYNDLWMNIRETKNNIQDVFITFKDRIQKCKFYPIYLI